MQSCPENTSVAFATYAVQQLRPQYILGIVGGRLHSTVCLAGCGLRAAFVWLCKSETMEDLYHATVVSRCTSKAISLPAAVLRDVLRLTALSRTYKRLCINWTGSPIEYNMQTPIFLGFDYICVAYNRGMAQDMIFDRSELAQPHEYSWPAVPYHANIRKSIQHKKMEPQTPRHQDCQYQYFRSRLYVP